MVFSIFTGTWDLNQSILEPSHQLKKKLSYVIQPEFPPFMNVEMSFFY